jgi:hypothetical protein
MFEALHEAEHLIEWTGLSAGALAGCVALAWFGWSIPAARRFAIAAGIAVVCVYGGELHGNAVGRADVTARWNAAKVAAAAEAKARDDRVRAELDAKYAGSIPAPGDQQSGDTNATQAMAAIAAAPGGGCRLGDQALRLRSRPKSK